MKPKKLHFDISTGLKTVLGSELITDDEVAIFELVKNSFDANAKNVQVVFESDAISIIDDGDGMSAQDIRHKWLFVAYSSKRVTEGANYREDIAKRRHYAGSKGIGRFSSDRLGNKTVLQTRPRKPTGGPVNILTVDWSLFDKNHLEQFQKIGIEYTEELSFEMPLRSEKIRNGTIITISEMKSEWTRDRILKLKSALAKLINPFGSSADGFTITMIAPDETEADESIEAKHESNGEEVPPNAVVNGEVGNFIFTTLKEKTTFLEVRLSKNGKKIESSLTDRGELIYRILEPNPYPLLIDSQFECQLYFLNTSAKQTFARRMGVPSVQFGSIFLFRNGFRVFPIGEEGDDWFRIDRRKQQGYARFLGTRDVIGRIEVSGPQSLFQESSSRNTGLITTEAVRQLQKCFIENCLKRLERYIVPVTYADKADRNTDDISRLLTGPGMARVSSAVAKLVDSDDIELIEYSHKLIDIIDEKSEQFESSLASLRAIAERTQDKKLYRRVEQAEKRFEQLKRAEEEARRRADEERAAKEAAEARAEASEEELQEERERNLFLQSISSLDTDTILNLHHQITIYAVDIQLQLQNFIADIASQKTVSKSEVINALERIILLNRKVMGVSKFATKANFRLKSGEIEADLGDYIREYIEGIASDFVQGKVHLEVSTDSKPFKRTIHPIEIAVVIDNLISNARKALATNMHFEITRPNKDVLQILVTDDGQGLSKSIRNTERIFEKGYTKTIDGSGLGLYHVRQVLGEMDGTIEVEKDESGRPRFIIRISR